jgi:hypothetical protein
MNSFLWHDKLSVTLATSTAKDTHDHRWDSKGRSMNQEMLVTATAATASKCKAPGSGGGDRLSLSSASFSLPE